MDPNIGQNRDWRSRGSLGENLLRPCEPSLGLWNGLGGQLNQSSGCARGQSLGGLQCVISKRMIDFYFQFLSWVTNVLGQGFLARGTMGVCRAMEVITVLILIY